MKGFLVQGVASFLSVVVWEFLVWVSRFSLRYLDMDHIGILNSWFIVFFISVNLLFWGFSNRRNKFFPFHEIEIKVLRSHLYPWVATGAYKRLIKKVVLYRTSLDSSVPVSVKYIIFFDVVYNQKTEETRKVHRDFLKMQTPILGGDFGCVYKGNPPINFHDEWLLTDKKPHGLSDKNAVVLFLNNPILRLFT